MTAISKSRYIDRLYDIADKNNNMIQKTIKMKPNDNNFKCIF